MRRQMIPARILLLCLGVLGPIAAEGKDEEGGLDLVWSYAAFGCDTEGNRVANQAFVEFTFAFNPNVLGQSDDGSRRLTMQLLCKESTTGATLSERWTVVATPAIGDSFVFDPIASVKTFRAEPGEYSGSLVVVDRSRPEMADTVPVDIFVPDMDGRTPAVSDLELITQMAPAPESKEVPFERLGYILRRNLTGVVTTYLHGYLELYDAHRMTQEGLTVAWRIADTAGRVLFAADSVHLRGTDPVKALTFSLPMANVPTGQYLLVATVSAGRGAARVDSVRRLRVFYVWNESEESTPVAEEGGTYIGEDFIDPIYAGLTERELDERYEVVSLLLLKRDRTVWDGLSGAEAKGRFLSIFWNRHGDPEMPGYQKREQFFERVSFAAKNYRSGLRPRGWDSDRGRVLIQYGEPDAIDRHVSDFNRHPYQIWTYSSHRAEFVFVDAGQTGAFQLVHSTARGELQNFNWERDHAQMLDDPNEFSGDDPFGFPR